MSWQDNGVGHCGTGAINESSGSNGLANIRTFLVSGADSSGNRLDIGIDSLVAGDYSCNGDGGVNVSFGYWRQTDQGLSVPTQSCSIRITSIGGAGAGNASGTFSAVLAPTEGGTEEISKGTFDGPPTINQPS
jgi:hypothetical protein